MFIDDTSSHWDSASQCMFAEHRSIASLGTPHTHLRRLLWHPYLLVRARLGSAQVPHGIRFPSSHAVVSQHVLVLVQAKSEFCPIDGVASAQHCVASMDVVPSVEFASSTLLSIEFRQGNMVISCVLFMRWYW